MIDVLSSWVKNLSLALIIVSILEMILPNNKTKKYIKLVMGIYILFTIIAPFVENNAQFNLEKVNWDFYEKTIQETSTEVNQTSMDIRLNQIFKEQVEKDIINKLREKGYELESCKVNAKISQGSENNNTIEKITIKVKHKISNRNLEVENSVENSVENLVENKIVTEIEKIKKVEIKVSEQNQNQEQDIENLENDFNKNSISKADIEEIKSFLSEEYGVNEKCLKIS